QTSKTMKSAASQMMVYVSHLRPIPRPRPSNPRPMNTICFWNMPTSATLCRLEGVFTDELPCRRDYNTSRYSVPVPSPDDRRYPSHPGDLDRSGAPPHAEDAHRPVDNGPHPGACRMSRKRGGGRAHGLPHPQQVAEGPAGDLRD